MPSYSDKILKTIMADQSPAEVFGLSVFKLGVSGFCCKPCIGDFLLLTSSVGVGFDVRLRGVFYIQQPSEFCLILCVCQIIGKDES